jgi:hypothetical protein
MKTRCIGVAIMLSIALAASAADKKIAKDKLPAAVQKTVDEQSKGATVVGFSTEQVASKTLYEASLNVNGHSKDVVIDADGKIVEIEEEVAFDSLPKDVQAALTKAAGAGKLGKVESLRKNGKLVAYEAKVEKAGKKSEVQVGPKGEKLNHEE